MSETFWLHVLFFSMIGVLHYCSIKHSERMEARRREDERLLIAKSMEKESLHKTETHETFDPHKR